MIVQKIKRLFTSPYPDQPSKRKRWQQYPDQPHAAHDDHERTATAATRVWYCYDCGHHYRPTPDWWPFTDHSEARGDDQ